MTVHTTKELRAALDGARPGAKIAIAAGDYRIKAGIQIPGITIEGAGASVTRLIWGDAAKDKDDSGRELVTFRTYTAAVLADHVTIRGISIINDAGHPELRGQEVALSAYGDDFLMEDCILSSTQDTLFAGPLPADLIERYRGFLPDCLRRVTRGRQHYRNCLIEGSVDFIFGCAEAVFDDCEIRSVFDVRNIGFVAAPAHPVTEERGFLFRNCRFTADEGVTDGSVFLARPWRDFGLASFKDCSYGEHISPLGFDKWAGTGRDATARFYESPPVAGRVGWINRPRPDASGGTPPAH